MHRLQWRNIPRRKLNRPAKLLIVLEPFPSPRPSKHCATLLCCNVISVHRRHLLVLLPPAPRRTRRGSPSRAPVVHPPPAGQPPRSPAAVEVLRDHDLEIIGILGCPGQRGLTPPFDGFRYDAVAVPVTVPAQAGPRCGTSSGGRHL